MSLQASCLGIPNCITLEVLPSFFYQGTELLCGLLEVIIELSAWEASGLTGFSEKLRSAVRYF